MEGLWWRLRGWWLEWWRLGVFEGGRERREGVMLGWSAAWDSTLSLIVFFSGVAVNARTRYNVANFLWHMSRH